MSRFGKSFIIAACALAIVFHWAPTCPAATQAQIDDAIAKAQKVVLANQHPGGHWETDDARVGNNHDSDHMQGETFGGYTALCTYALLASGVSSNDPQMQQAIAFLKKADVIGFYALGIRMQVWLLLWRDSAENQRKEYAALANADAMQLLHGLHTDDDAAGYWTYLGPGVKADPPIGGEADIRVDHSISQYGILGLWAAAQMGGEIPVKYWQAFDNVWRRDQFPDGGWAYSATPTKKGVNNEGETPGMTAAGIASLFIIQDYTQANRGAGCTGNIANANIDMGLQWMTQHFADVNDPYSFYGIERIGTACGYKYFGQVDWFAQIADKLLKDQNVDGTFCRHGLDPYPGETPLASTCFGLLFLTRGGAPVIMNKLQYSTGDESHQTEAHWNQRPRDLYNLARWSGEQSEADLNWQVVKLGVPVEQLHDAPILYIAGDQGLRLSQSDEEKLRQFVIQGGMILGNADCNSLSFKNAFIALGKKLFPAYRFETIGKDSIILKEAHAKFRGTPQLMGLSNGVRELMLLMPTGDPSRSWQNSAMFGPNRDNFQLGFNIFLYAVDTKGLRKKADTYLVTADPAVQPARTVKVARLMVGENPDPEPGGWPRLSAILHNAPYKIDLQVTPVTPGTSLDGYQVVSLTGTSAFTLDAGERAQLLQFAHQGGTIIIDAAGGSGTFADSAEAELQSIFGKDAATALAHPLPADSPVYHLPSADIQSFDYRAFARAGMVGKTTAPRIDGIEVGGRPAVFFSREDLSAGLVGEDVDGIAGYTPQCATDIMRNLVLFAAGQSK